MALLWIPFRLTLTDRRICVAFERGAVMDLSFIPDIAKGFIDELKTK